MARLTLHFVNPNRSYCEALWRFIPGSCQASPLLSIASLINHDRHNNSAARAFEKLAVELGKDLHGSSAEALSLPSPAIGLAPELVLQDAHLVPKIGIIVGDPADMISPDSAAVAFENDRGRGLVNQSGARGTCYPSTRSSNSGQSASTPAKSEPITSYCGPLETVCTGVLALAFETVRKYGTAFFATAYAIYLPFATATGAVAGEIDA